MTQASANIPLVKIHAVNDLRLDSVAYPDCGPDDLILQVKQCGICGSDLGYLAKGGVMGPGEPMALGHELWGLVHEVGANVTHVELGDRVIVQPMSNDNFIGNGGPEGGFSSYLAVRNAAKEPASTPKIPVGLPDAYGALVEPLAVAQHGANRVAAKAEDKAVVFGAGPIGLALLLILQYRGLKNVAVVDLSDKRLQLAASLGAHVIRGDSPDIAEQLIEHHGTSTFFGMPMPGSTLFFEATGNGAVFEKLIEIAGPGSRICLTGVHTSAVSLDLMMMLAKEVSIIPAMGYVDEFTEVLALLESGDVDPTVMVSHHFPLSEIHAAFETAQDAQSAIKVMVECQI